MTDTDALTLLQRAQDALNHATTPEDVRHAHSLLSLAIRRQRRVESRTLGPLASSYGEAIAIYLASREAGATREEAVVGLEQVLRERWPQSGRVWKYLCDDCGDTGWVACRCTHDTRCDGWSTFSHTAYSPMQIKRRLCTQQTDYEHDYTKPCFCAKGDSARAAITKAQAGARKRNLDDAGSGFTRVGRKS